MNGYERLDSLGPGGQKLAGWVMPLQIAVHSETIRGFLQSGLGIPSGRKSVLTTLVYKKGSTDNYDN